MFFIKPIINRGCSKTSVLELAESYPPQAGLVEDELDSRAGFGLRILSRGMPESKPRVYQLNLS
jgi:hypothetical protein